MEQKRKIQDISVAKNSSIITGFLKKVFEVLMMLNLIWLAYLESRSVSKTIKTIKKMKSFRERLLTKDRLTKIVKSGGRVFLDMHSPGWPSRAFNEFYRDEISRVAKAGNKINLAKLMVFSITNNCPLRCEHCFEADYLGKKDDLTLADLMKIIQRLSNLGLSKVGLSGGEPMTRIDDIIELVTKFYNQIDFWILTSGFNLTEENAKRLKKAGITGLSISLDYIDSLKHNRFRNSHLAFSWATNAMINAKKADLLVCATLCATRDFIENQDLYKYAEKAKALGASFIQIVEPHAVGAYAGRDVSLTEENKLVLEKFFRESNSNPKHADLPIVAYNAYHQRRTGCFGNANRYLFVDSSGNAHPCHFCRISMGSLLDQDYIQILEKLRNYQGCNFFRQAAVGFNHEEGGKDNYDIKFVQKQKKAVKPESSSVKIDSDHTLI